MGPVTVSDTAQFTARVAANRPLTGGYFQLDLETDAATPIDRTRAGQFVMLRGDWGRDLINGRAFSILEAPDPRHLSVLAKVFGRGTARLEASQPGDPITVTGPLGTPFPAPRTDRTQLLVAGGVGLPPLHLYSRQAAAAGVAGHVEMLYGGRTADDIVLTEPFKGWGVALEVSTDDGTRGVEGRVTVALEARLERAKANGEVVEILSCGPTPMLRSVRTIGLARGISTHLCLEEQMACGFGVCLGCAVPVYGPRPYKYCCTDGPVFDAREVRWT